MTESPSFDGRLQKFKYTEEASPSRQSPRHSGDRGSKRNLDEDEPVPKRMRTTKLVGATPRRRASGKYAAPSRYAHLSPLVDVLEPGLKLVFVGLNPGISTAVTGHAYAHPSNRFWHLLHVSGLTPERKLSPSENRDLPRLYGYGTTNLVARPTKDQSELSKDEMVQGTATLEAKVRNFKPEVICIVGKGIWEAIWKYKHGRNMTKEEFSYGWQNDRDNLGLGPQGEIDAAEKPWRGSRVFVATTTSGLAASMRPAEREAVWKVLGEYMVKRRQETAEINDANVQNE